MKAIKNLYLHYFTIFKVDTDVRDYEVIKCDVHYCTCKISKKQNLNSYSGHISNRAV